MSVDKYWQTTRPLRHVDKTRGIVVVPAFAQALVCRSCLSLGGTASEIVVTDPVNLAADGDISAEVWVKIPRYDTPSAINIFDNTTTLLYVNDGKVRFVIQNLTDRFLVESSLAIEYDTWTHIAAVKSGNSLLMYINGVLDTVSQITTGSGLDIASDTNLVIGNINDVNREIRLSNLAYFNRAISQLEITTAYERGIILPTETGLQALFYFREEIGSTTATNVVTSNVFVLQQDIYNTAFIDDGPGQVFNKFGEIVGYFTIVNDAGRPFSLVYPVDKPTNDVDFVPCVAWYDRASNTVKRYSFWRVVGDDLFPYVREYRGEVIPATGCRLEIWSIPQQGSVDLTGPITLQTSLLYVAVDYSHDIITTDNAGNPLVSLNVNIYSDLPLDFTGPGNAIVFNQPQVCPANAQGSFGNILFIQDDSGAIFTQDDGTRFTQG